jgi:hypothetical protein
MWRVKGGPAEKFEIRQQTHRVVTNLQHGAGHGFQSKIPPRLLSQRSTVNRAEELHRQPRIPPRAANLQQNLTYGLQGRARVSTTTAIAANQPSRVCNTSQAV